LSLSIKSRLGWEIHRCIDFYHAERRILAGSMNLIDDEKKLVKQASARIHPKDDMYRLWDASHYLSVGLSAIRFIDRAIQKVESGISIRKVLDMPCGYGRVLRFLVNRFPNSSLTACDIDAQAVRFCAKNFQAVPVLSKKDFSRLELSGTFDLIWCGSLITHIDEPSAVALLRFFRDHLSEAGICIFSTHGRTTADLIQNKKNSYGLADGGQERVLRDFFEKGYGYADYPGQSGYGISVVSADRIRALAASTVQWREIDFEEKGWDDHHDVYAYGLASRLSPS
jgi:SAM-dependent methyltransferase